ncbi:MAG TPA: hypothetical protein VG758_07040 [Hyphomicrobiaceae bacterium]|nr:hypothetical protein [Hyphomicrobiaceae bacterium]
MYHGRRWCTFGACLVGWLSTNAHAAGPYAVDDATIGDVGQCHVESWVSAADNGDIIVLTQPACVVRLGIPVEVTTTLQGVRVEGLWAALLGLQGKFILLPFDARGLAIAMAIGTLADADRGESLTFVNVPFTIKIGDDFRLNVNTGWSFNSISDTNHFTWGAGLEWDLQKSWTLVAEIFGQTTIRTEPRMQLGVRHSPTKDIDIDIVYGHNIAGENANWITAALTVRF